MIAQPSLAAIMQERLVILDGATGTALQTLNLTPDDFGGLDGCNEFLNLSRPDAIRRLHASYLEVGVDAVLTNTFGASAVVLAEYGIAGRAAEINRAGAEIAVATAREFSTPERPRFVLGSMGPGTKMPSLGQISFDDLHAGYVEQAEALLDGRVDALLVETCFDLLQVKAAIIACHDAMKRRGVQVPLFNTVTVETTGQMLLGTEIGAALTALAPLGLTAFGLNCATGPELMHEHLRYLAEHSPMALMVQPNAGLPRVEDGRTVYGLTPEALVAAHTTFVRDYGARVIGGCCGTTPEHMRQVVAALWGVQPAAREPHLEPAVASVFVSVPYRQDASFLIVGERANANGSRRFRRLLEAEDVEAMANILRDQAQEGVHVADLCVDFVGRDGVADMQRVVAAASSRTTLPLVLDSTEPPVLEAGLKLLGGKPMLNSITLEDGGARLARTVTAARRFGAALVALVIDEEGQARTAERKLAIAKRIHAIVTQVYGIPAHDLFFDALTLPLGSGQDELRNDGKETLTAIRAIKAELPGVHTILGVSNVSFGLNPATRQVLNSVFLHEAVKAGLDAAIVNAQQILPEHRIPEEQRRGALLLIYNDWEGAVDPLPAFMALFEDASVQREAVDLSNATVEERLHHRIVDGMRQDLADDITEALESRGALEIINDTLLPAMQVVGDLFGAGKMQLPFVLQSAEVMKSAVALLEPHMDKADSRGRGTVVLATVRGDVHDIGKNLVDIILSNNGYSTVNLGIKQPIQTIVEAAEQHSADAIGLSGLLVKSTLVMKEDLEELNRRGLAGRFPVLLGGAALTRAYVEQDLRSRYQGRVYYGQDAFEGLAIMNALMDGREPDGQRRTAARPARAATAAAAAATATTTRVRSQVRTDAPVPVPPFWGRRAVRGIPLRDVYPYINEVALFRGQWGYRKGEQTDADFDALLEREARPVLRRVQEEALTHGILQAAVYGYFPAQSDGDDLIIYHEDRRSEWLRFHFPRQPAKQRLCLADFFRPVESGEMDVAAFHVVTVGAAASAHTQALYQRNAYQDYLYWHGFSVEMAEALAEYWHQRIRRELGIAAADGPAMRDLFAARYQGQRFSFGYPACPSLEAQAQLFELLQPDAIGVTLSEEFQLVPEQSTSAIITHHPEAAYFSV